MPDADAVTTTAAPATATTPAASPATRRWPSFQIRLIMPTLSHRGRGGSLCICKSLLYTRPYGGSSRLRSGFRLERQARGRALRAHLHDDAAELGRHQDRVAGPGASRHGLGPASAGRGAAVGHG